MIYFTFQQRIAGRLTMQLEKVINLEVLTVINKNVSVISIALGAILLSGCSSKEAISPTAYAEVSTKQCAKYEILGNTEATVTDKKVLGIIDVDGEDDNSGSLEDTSVAWFDSADEAKQQALYKAIENVPEADALLAPRYHIEEDKVPLFYSKRKVTVRGKAIKYSPAEC